jgi:hypothetical protein
MQMTVKAAQQVSTWGTLSENAGLKTVWCQAVRPAAGTISPHQEISMSEYQPLLHLNRIVLPAMNGDGNRRAEPQRSEPQRSAPPVPRRIRRVRPNVAAPVRPASPERERVRRERRGVE